MIREHPRFQNRAIIFVSRSVHTISTASRPLCGGAVDYVPVSVVPDRCRAKVGRVLPTLAARPSSSRRLNAYFDTALPSGRPMAHANADLETGGSRRHPRARRPPSPMCTRCGKVEILGQLTGGVAHDFTILVDVGARNLERWLKVVPATPRIRRLIDGAIQGAERGATRTKRMLACARPPGAKPETSTARTWSTALSDAAPLARACVLDHDRIRGRSAPTPGRPQPASTGSAKPRLMPATRCRSAESLTIWRTAIASAAVECSGAVSGEYVCITPTRRGAMTR